MQDANVRYSFPAFFPDRDVTSLDLRGDVAYAVSPLRIVAWEHGRPEQGLQPKWSLDKPGATICRLSRKGDVLVVAGASFVAALIAATGAIIWEREVTDQGRQFVQCLTTSRDDKMLAVTYQDMHGNIDLFNVSTGETVKIIDMSFTYEGYGFRGVDFLSGNRLVVVDDDFGRILIVGIENGDLLEEWPEEGAQPNCVVTDDRDNCYISCAEVPMMKWKDGQEAGEGMDSTADGMGVTQCVAWDPDTSTRRLIGAAFAHVAIFDPDTCEALTRVSLPSEQYHIHSVRGSGAGVYGGVFQRNFCAEDAPGTSPQGVFFVAPVFPQ